MRFPEFPRDFSELLVSFNAAGVKYLVVGAYALAAHGSPRNTSTSMCSSNRRRPTVVVEALRAFGFGTLRVVRVAGSDAMIH